jgi:hypothetical protein
MRSGRFGALLAVLAAGLGVSPQRPANVPAPVQHRVSRSRRMFARRRYTKAALDRAKRDRRNKIAARSRLVNRRKAA